MDIGNKKCVAVILAAGEGTRMKSYMPKVLHKANGKELVRWAADAAEEALGTKPVIVYGSGGNKVPDALGDSYSYALQDKRMGSGHAVMCAKDAILKSGVDYCFILAGDMPLIRAESIKKVVDKAMSEDYDLLIMTGMIDEPKGYGRIIRSEKGVEAIVEEKDATDEQRKIKEVNVSVYCYKVSALVDALGKLKPNNAAGEYYITDCLYILNSEGKKCGAISIDDFEECIGVNDKVQLAGVSKTLRMRKAEELMRSGVTLIDPQNVYIESTVKIGKDSVIYPGVVLEGNTVIGEKCVIFNGCYMKDVFIADESVIVPNTIFN